MWKHHLLSEPPTARVVATPELKARIDAQGRRHDWLAARLGVSKSLISKLVAGQSTVSLADARVIAALIDADPDVVFVLAEDRAAEAVS